ncbi:hypothetical protein CHUAL_009567 [Chamberlinius hualienensis]
MLKAYQGKSSKNTQQHVNTVDQSLESNSTSERNVDTSTSIMASSSESLRQISMQLNGLIYQTEDCNNGDVANERISELEKRNQELASNFETQKQRNEQLSSELLDTKSEIERLHQQMKKANEGFDERLFKEHSSLREQLQVHIQTIGILVAEKTELQSGLSQCQQTAKHKAAEVEGLQGRLKASRQQVAELERELATNTRSTQQIEKSNKENSKDVDRLKMEIYKSKKINEELEQRCSELQEKLSAKLNECESHNEMIESLEKKQAMLEVRIKQLSSGNLDEDEGGLDHMEQLQQAKVELEQKNTQLKETIQKMTNDRNQIAETYETFTKQLQMQIIDLNLQITTLQTNNTQFIEEINSLTQINSQLELSFHESSKLKDLILDLETKLKKFQAKDEQFQTQLSDNSELSRLLEENESVIEELERKLEEARSVQVDKNQLLEDMQSDKVAASRAIAQNRELKKQLEELQNAFVKLSNSKLELTEKLMQEQHVNKELGERLAQQEEEITELRDQLSDRERRLSLMEKSSTEITKHLYQQTQIADRMRHFEAQGQLTGMLQDDLSQAHKRIAVLTSQNSELRTTLANQAENLLKSESSNADESENKDSFRKDELVVSLSASVRQLEMERNQLMKQLEEQQLQRQAFKVQLEELTKSRSNINGDSEEQNFNLKYAMTKLEERFTKTMNSIAELSDEKQQLEYLVLQLQGETETIGDYIVLYQMQRNAMKQQVAKKDEYITRVTRDREELKDKLSKLQQLVHTLLSEREQMLKKNGKSLKMPGKALPDYLIHSVHHDQDTNGFDVLQNGVGDEEPSLVPTVEANPAKTVQSIIELISEIGSNDLMDKIVPDNFHPCPVCSGRLMTV